MTSNPSTILVTGPSRSGKSEWAETLASQSEKSVIYVATASIDRSDQEWVTRIQQHQQRRPAEWVTVSEPVALSKILLTYQQPNYCILIDSLGTWLANILEQDEIAWKDTLTLLLTTLTQTTADVIIVAEETGWGVVPAYPMGRTFRDRLGSLTRRVGSIADTVYLVTGGYVLNLTQLGTVLPSQ
ncbi:MAG: bifunctional adenosylcobinamide kinase/adenosylcobinamide-phosphate guanylyltransferase [Microcoleaceae cyanobacterium]